MMIMETADNPYDDLTMMTNAERKVRSMDVRERNNIIIDSATTHSILQDKCHFISLNKILDKRITTISGTQTLSNYVGNAHIRLPNGTILFLEDALWAPQATQNLLSFKDVLQNRHHLIT